MQVIADIDDGHGAPWGLTTESPDRATGASRKDGGRLFPIEGGVLGDGSIEITGFASADHARAGISLSPRKNPISPLPSRVRPAPFW